MKIILTILLINIGFIASAQPKAVQIELSETFAQYQNAYNNATEAHKMLTTGYKRSSSLNDARYYLGSARKYTEHASKYCSNASKSAKNTRALEVVQACEVSDNHYSNMDTQFVQASEKFRQSKMELDLAMAETDFSVIGEHLSSAMTFLQSGVLKLNLAVEEMNSGSSEMKNCK